MDGIVKPLLFLFGTSRRLDGSYFAGLDVFHHIIRYKVVPLMSTS